MNLHYQLYDIIITTSKIRITFVGLEKFRRYNWPIIHKYGITELFEIPGVVVIINKWGLIIRIAIYNMVKMERRNDIGVDVVNKLPIREDGKNNQDQTPK